MSSFGKSIPEIGLSSLSLENAFCSSVPQEFTMRLGFSLKFGVKDCSDGQLSPSATRPFLGLWEFLPLAESLVWLLSFERSVSPLFCPFEQDFLCNNKEATMYSQQFSKLKVP